MSFGIYLIGFIIMVVGLAMGANMMGVSSRWITVGVVTMVGLGLLLAVKNTRMRDPS